MAFDGRPLQQFFICMKKKRRLQQNFSPVVNQGNKFLLRDAGVFDLFIGKNGFESGSYFLEFWGGLHWPREKPLEETRQQRWMFGIESRHVVDGDS